MIKAHIIGRLGKDAEETTQGQRQVLRFSVATDDREKDQSGQWVKKTVWVNVQTYQTNLKPYLTKGKQVMVSGDLRLGIWNRTDGTASLDASVFGADVTLLGGDQQGTPQGTQQAPQSTQQPRVAQQPAPQPKAQQSAQNGLFAEPSDELPFL